MTKGELLRDSGNGITDAKIDVARPWTTLFPASRDPQVGRARTEPAAGRVARRGVVVGQLLTGGATLVTGGDLPGELRAAVAGMQLVQRHHRSGFASSAATIVDS